MSIFKPFYILYLVLIVVPISFQLKTLIDSYVFLVTITVFCVFLLLSKMKISKINISELKIEQDHASDKLLYISLFIPLLSSFIYLYLVGFDISILTGDFVMSDKHDLRLKAISVPYYSIFFKNMITILMPISIILLIRQRYIFYSISLVVIFLFFSASNEKYPFLLYFFIALWVIQSTGRLNFKYYMLFATLITVILAYMIKVTMNQSFGFDALGLTVSALFDRISVISELVIFSYHEFENGNYLDGATLPELFGVIPLNVSSTDSINISHYLMMLKTGGAGGANASFITEGFINFGYGFDLLFVAIAAIWSIFILRLAKLFLSDSNVNTYNMTYMFLLCDLINTNMWVTIHGSGFILAYLFAFERLAKIGWR